VRLFQTASLPESVTILCSAECVSQSTERFLGEARMRRVAPPHWRSPTESRTGLRPGRVPWPCDEATVVSAAMAPLLAGGAGSQSMLWLPAGRRMKC
jgi:hypothetical protein